MRYSRLLSLILSLPLTALASGGKAEYRLPWPHKNQILLYHSCGCADACWVAELRDRHKPGLKARLRCDCSKLFFKSGNNAEKMPGASCQEFQESEDKAALIQRKLTQLLKQAN